MSTDRIDIRIDVQQQGADALQQINDSLAQTQLVGAALETEFARLNTAVAQATIGFENGATNADEYRRALQRIRDEGRQLGIDSVQLERNLSGLQNQFGGSRVKEFRKATASVVPTLDAVNVASKRAARQGLGTIRSSMASLTSMAIGTRGTLGTLAGGILQFAAGNALAIGAIAGIAAIAFAFRKLTSDAREAKKKIDDHIASLEKLRELEVTPLEKVGKDIEGAQTRLAEFNAELTKLEVKLAKDPGRDVRAILLFKQKKLLDDIAEQEDLIAIGERTRAEERGKEDDEREATLNTEIGLLTRGLELGILTTEAYKRYGKILGDIGKELLTHNVTLERQIQLLAQRGALVGGILEALEPAVRAGQEAFARAIAEASAAALAAIPSSITPQEAGTLSEAAGRRSRGDAAIQARQDASRQAFQEANARAVALALATIESAMTAQERIAGQIATIQAALPGAGAAAGAMVQALEILEGKLGDTARQAEISGARIVLAFGQMAELIIQGLRGRGGLLSGLIGTAGSLLSVASFASPLGGAAILAGSGILSGLLRPGRDPVRVRIDDIDERAIDKARRLGPDTIIVQLLDAQGRPIREIAADLRDLERRDGINRFSGKVQGTVTSFSDVG